jgi:PAS domain S-box-containing protein
MKDQSLRVLMVEDSEDDELLIIRELKKGGYNPVYERIETAVAMKKALKDRQWDIILCDYNLPKLNAPSAIAELKEANIDIPIIIVSGTIGEDVAIECMRLGAQDYIMKHNMSRLCSAIARELKDAEVRSREKHIEEKLRYEEQRCRAFVEHSLDIIVILNPEGIITYVNPAVERVLGFKPEERIGAKGFELVHPDDMKILADSFNTLVKDTNSPVIQCEMRLRHKDGSWRTMEVIGSNLVNGNVVEAVIVNYRDITERKLLGRSLAENEARLRTLVQTIPDLIWLKDADGVYLACNKMFERCFGARETDIVGKTDYDFVDRKQADFFREHDRKAIAAGKPSANEEWITFADDGYRGLFETIKTPMYDIDGRLIGVLGIARDITGFKKSEEALKNSEEKYRTILEDIQEGYFEVDFAGNFTFFNDSLCRYFDYSREELMGMNYSQYTEKEHSKELFQTFNKVYSTGELTEGFDWQIIKKDGTKRYVEASVSLRKDSSGNPIGFRGIARDITERKHADEQLHQTLGRLKKAVGTTIGVLGTASETRDPYTAGHQKRVADLARTIATEMGLSTNTIEGIRMAGSIHDIGKLSIPAEILSKPTKLTNIEFSLIKGHPQIGYEMLKDVESPWPLAQIVYQHHERINGSGYPRNLKGDDILIEARVMAVADVVEAMASHRPYRPGLGIEAALEEIEKNKGILYDNVVADACLKVFREKGYQLR